MEAKTRMREATLLGVLAVLVLVLIGADLAFFSGLEETAPAATPEATARTPDAPQAEATDPVTTGPASSEQCAYDLEKDRVANYAELVSFMDPAKGNPQAKVTVIEYFDPNCPHCKTLLPVMDEVAEKYGDRARIYYKAIPIWDFSVPQIEALYAAAHEGKFFDMLPPMFALQDAVRQEKGMTVMMAEELARRSGMDPSLLLQRLQAGTFRNTAMQQRQKAVDAGLSSVPAVLINGRFVKDRTAACIGQLIEAAAE